MRDKNRERAYARLVVAIVGDPDLRGEERESAVDTLTARLTAELGITRCVACAITGEPMAYLTSEITLCESCAHERYGIAAHLLVFS